MTPSPDHPADEVEAVARALHEEKMKPWSCYTTSELPRYQWENWPETGRQASIAQVENSKEDYREQARAAIAAIDNARAQKQHPSDAVKVEREACAKIADDHGEPNRFEVCNKTWQKYTPTEVYEAAAVDVSVWIAAAIRARAQQQPSDAVKAAILAEREACAKIAEEEEAEQSQRADDFHRGSGDHDSEQRVLGGAESAMMIAAAIRARGEK